MSDSTTRILTPCNDLFVGRREFYILNTPELPRFGDCLHILAARYAPRRRTVKIYVSSSWHLEIQTSCGNCEEEIWHSSIEVTGPIMVFECAECGHVHRVKLEFKAGEQEATLEDYPLAATVGFELPEQVFDRRAA